MENTKIDNNAINGLNKNRVKDRAIDEMIGICKGVLFDGAVSTGEAQHLLTWLNANPIVAADWFGRDLYGALMQCLEDGVVDSDEEASLLDILLDITGRSEINIDGTNAATTLPLCLVPPTKIIIENGGFVKKNANTNCHYLVIGEVGSGAWMHSSFGRKIEQAVATRDSGYPIAIISEQCFFERSKI